MLSFAIYISTLFIVAINCTKMPEFRSVEDIANPLKNPEQCGQNRPHSNICDPDNIISEEQAAQLDGLINSIYNNTACVCPHRICREGYRIGIAMIKDMKVDPTVRSSLYKSNGEKSSRYLDLMLNEAKIFSYTLLGQWNMSICHADVLIFYSMNDNVLYTTTNNKTRQNLTDELIGEIWLDLRKQFSSNAASIAEGFAELLTLYNDVFLNKYKSGMKIGDRPAPEPADMDMVESFSSASQQFSRCHYLTVCFLCMMIYHSRKMEYEGN